MTAIVNGILFVMTYVLFTGIDVEGGMEEYTQDHSLHGLALDAKHGDAHALEQLLTHPEVKRVIYAIAGEKIGWNEADDVYQHVRMIIWEKIHTWQERASLLVWVTRITQNTCVDMLRKLRPHRIILTDIPPEGLPKYHDEPEQITRTIVFQRQEILEQILSQLGAPCEQFLTLHIFQGVDKPEIMNIFQLKQSSFYNKWNLCYQALLEKIQQRLS